jgi:hypothetical protein
VLTRLRAAFIACPELAVYSRSPTHFERIAGPIDGAKLLAAVTSALGHRSQDYVWLIERARAEVRGLTISELCAAKGWPRCTFYDRTRSAAGRVALYLNQHGHG